MQLINFSDGGWEFSLIDLHSFFETIKQLEQYQNSHQCNHYMYLVDGDESTYQHNKEPGGDTIFYCIADSISHMILMCILNVEDYG